MHTHITAPNTHTQRSDLPGHLGQLLGQLLMFALLEREVHWEQSHLDGYTPATIAKRICSSSNYYEQHMYPTHL